MRPWGGTARTVTVMIPKVAPPELEAVTVKLVGKMASVGTPVMTPVYLQRQDVEAGSGP